MTDVSELSLEAVCSKCGHIRPLKQKDNLAACKMVTWNLIDDIACNHCKATGGLSIRTVGTNLVGTRGDDNEIVFSDISQ